MPKIEKKEFMTHVVSMHCGDPLGKQQAITNKNKVGMNSEIFHLKALLFSLTADRKRHVYFVVQFYPWFKFYFPLF